MKRHFFFVKGINYIKSADMTNCVEYEDTGNLEKWYWGEVEAKNRDWFEYFDERITKFYLDWDKEVDREIDFESIEKYYKVCKDKCDFIADLIYEKMGEEVKYFCATRTGNGLYKKYDKNRGEKIGYKISLRFYFNFSILNTHIPFFLKKINQSNFWDINPYHKTNQKINLIGCTKSKIDTRILLPYNGKKFINEYNPLNYIVQNIEDCITGIEISETIKSYASEYICNNPVKMHSNNNYKLIISFLDANLLTSYADDYRSWINIGLCLKTIFSDENGKTLFHLFSSKSSKYNEYECEKVWKSLNPSGILTMGTIRHYAKQKSEIHYYKLIGEMKENKFSDIFNNGALDVIDYISDEIKSYVVYCQKNWFIFNEETNLWECKSNPKTYIVRICRKILENEKSEILQNDTDDKTQKINTLNNIYKLIDTSSFKNNMEEHMKNILLNDNFNDNFDDLRGKLVFKNGILNLETGIFQSGYTYNDLISQTLNFNYNENINTSDVEWIEERIKEICNNNDEDKEDYLSILGYALTGMSEKEQYFFTLYGPSASNGKTIIFDVLNKVFSIYCRKIDKRTFLDGWAKSHKELIHFKNKRFIWQDELPKKKLDCELLKDIINGVSISVERLFDTNELIKISGKLFILTNNSINIDYDNGLIRRSVILEFISRFYKTKEEYEENKYNTPEDKKFMANKNLLDEFIKRKEAFAYLLIKYACKYFKDGLVIDKKNKINDENQISDECGLTQLISDNIITINILSKNNEFITSKKEIVDIVEDKIKGVFKFNEIKDFLKAYNVKYDPQKFKGTRGDPRGCFIGIKINQNY